MFGRTCNFAKSSLFGQIYASYASSISYSCQYLSSKIIFLVSFVRLKYQICRNLRIFWGKIWFEDFAPCKRIDISQLWGESSLSISPRLSFMSGSQVMYLNTSFEIVVESTLEEHHHEEDPEFTTKENYHWIAQQEQVPPPTPQQRHPVYFGSEDFFLIVANQSRFCLNPW